MPNFNKEQQLQRIVDKYVKAYKSDFDYDKQTLSMAEKGDKFLWIVRLHGTHLINKNKVVNDETLQYWREHNNVDGEQDVKYYEIDADTWKPTAIHNIDDYYNQCKTDYEYQQMYKDEYDDYEYYDTMTPMNKMTVRELNKDQMNELKCRYYSEKTDEDLSYSEMLDIDKIVSDEEVFNEYADTYFSEDDFACNSVDKDDIDYEY